MKSLISFFLILFLSLPFDSFSQNINNDKMLQTFWKDFKNVVLKNDKEKAADITNFPFQHDNGIGRTRKDFIKQFDNIFTSSIKNKMKKGKEIVFAHESLVDGKSRITYSFYVTEDCCFYFMLFDDKVKLTSYICLTSEGGYFI